MIILCDYPGICYLTSNGQSISFLFSSGPVRMVLESLEIIAFLSGKIDEYHIYY